MKALQLASENYHIVFSKYNKKKGQEREKSNMF